jgi:hypothetical protein
MLCIVMKTEAPPHEEETEPQSMISWAASLGKRKLAVAEAKVF